MTSPKRRPKPSLPKSLLAWYAIHRRTLPWRAEKGAKPNPYHVWLSEIMLQQTTVPTVGSYFMAFIAKWPTLKHLAKASLDEVFQMWAGLGYYRRARYLHAAAQELTEKWNGQFPENEADLITLPGCGPYTAAAIAAIAFDKPAAVVDGNVERVLARIHAIQTPMPALKKEIRAIAAAYIPTTPTFSTGDFAQAMMDLGSAICTPRSPKCDQCPLAKICDAKKQKCTEEIPRPAPKKTKPTRRATAFCAFDKKGRLYIRKRPMEGLLAGMMEVPSSKWEEGRPEKTAQILDQIPFQADWKPLKGGIKHVFTHFNFDVRIMIALDVVTKTRPRGSKWVAYKDLRQEALPSLMQKIIRYAHASLKDQK